MKYLVNWRNTLTNRFLARPFNSLNAEELAERLALSGRKLERTLTSAADTPANRRLVSHIVGIERWGQSRLRVALGAPLVRDEYDSYRPPRDADWPALQAAFAATRDETVALTRQLAAPLTQEVAVLHNQFGPLRLRAWLRYLDMHASWEAKKLR